MREPVSHAPSGATPSLRRITSLTLLPKLASLVTVVVSSTLLMSCAGAPSSTGVRKVVAVPAGQMPPPAPKPMAKAPEPEPEPEPAWPESFADAAQKITAATVDNTRAWDRLAYMVDMFGPRLSGSKALEQAIDWTLETMRQDGLENVRREKVMVPHWVRGRESAMVTAPVERELVVLGLGGTVGTGRRGVKGEVVAFESLEALQKAGEANPKVAEDKIVVINQKMPDFDPHNPTDPTGYGKTVVIRSSGASTAAKFGAKAVLIRSVTAHSLRTPHTGALRYEDGVKKIPAAAVTPADAEFLVRMAQRGPTTVQLKLDAKTLADAESANAIAEIKGREKPEEVVVIGGHIDSWDVGDGATDDGSGCLMAMEAAKILMETGLRPRRTIRVVLFTNEENGLRGGKAYAEAHAKEVHAGAIEADIGAGAPMGISMAADDATVAALAKYAPLFEGLGAAQITQGWGGADISPLMATGVLGLGMRPDVSHYFDLHHSPADTVEKIDPAYLQRNAGAMALMAWILAEREEIAQVEVTKQGADH